MGGIDVYCGSFAGDDKSGSAFEAVFRDLEERSSPDVAALVRDLIAQIDDASDHLLIPAADAAQLLPALREYELVLIGDAVAETPLAQMVFDEEAAGKRLEPSESLGWKLYCIGDLITACETAATESEPVALVW